MSLDENKSKRPYEYGSVTAKNGSSSKRAKLSGDPSKYIHRRWYQIQANAEKHQREFTLSEQEVGALLSSSCAYCNFKGEPQDVQIDRIDNDKGYCLANVAATCKPCNMAKGSLLLEDFLARCICVSYFRGIVFTTDVEEKVDVAQLERRLEFIKSTGLPMEITDEDLMKLMQKSCSYCAFRLTTGCVGLKDPTQGFIKGNVISVCTCCYSGGKGLSSAAYIAHCQQIYTHCMYLCKQETLN